MSWQSVLGDIASAIFGGHNSNSGPTLPRPVGMPTAPGGRPPLPNWPANTQTPPVAASAQDGSSDDNGDESIWQKILGLAEAPFETNGQFDWTKLAKLGLGAAAYVGQRQASNKAQSYVNAAQADYASRAPLRNEAFTSLGNMLQTGPATSKVFNKYLNSETQGSSSASSSGY